MTGGEGRGWAETGAASSAHLVLFVENHRGELVWAQRANRCIKRPGTTSSPSEGVAWGLHLASQSRSPAPPTTLTTQSTWPGPGPLVHPAASAEPSAPCFWPNPGGVPLLTSLHVKPSQLLRTCLSVPARLLAALLCRRHNWTTGLHRETEPERTLCRVFHVSPTVWSLW